MTATGAFTEATARSLTNNTLLDGLLGQSVNLGVGVCPPGGMQVAFPPESLADLRAQADRVAGMESGK